MSTIIYNNLKKIVGARTYSEKELSNIASHFKLIKSGKGSKYNNLHVRYRGRIYDSLSEGYYAYLLDQLEDKGIIKSYKQQINYSLPDLNGGKRYRYCADFVVIGNSGQEYVIDIKGRLTSENKIKYAYWQYVYDKKLHIVMTSGAKKFDTDFIK